jgi:hypothetical protein
MYWFPLGITITKSATLQYEENTHDRGIFAE